MAPSISGAINQWRHQSVAQSISGAINQWRNQSVTQSISDAIHRYRIQSAAQSISGANKQRRDPSAWQSISMAIDQHGNRSASQPINIISLIQCIIRPFFTHLSLFKTEFPDSLSSPLDEFLQAAPPLIRGDARVHGDILHDPKIGTHGVGHSSQVGQLRDKHNHAISFLLNTTRAKN